MRELPRRGVKPRLAGPCAAGGVLSLLEAPPRGTASSREGRRHDVSSGGEPALRRLRKPEELS